MSNKTDDRDDTDQGEADQPSVIWPLLVVVLVAGFLIAFAATGASW